MCSRHAEYGAGYDIDSLSADGAQESLTDFHVLMDLNRWDPDEGRAWITVHAFDSLDAMRQVKQMYPAASVLRAEAA